MRHSRDTSPRRSRTRGLVASFAAVAVGVTGLVALAASAAATPPVPAEKYFVCKYVGTPGENERLQTGSNPISVSENALPDGFTVGGYFADSQGRSYVLALDDTAPGPAGDPDASACPPGDPIDETPVQVPVTPALFTAPTCEAPGTLVGVDTESYQWVASGPADAKVLTATKIGNVTLTGQTVFGPYDLTQLTGEICLSEQPREVEVDPAVFTAPTCEAFGTLVGVDTADYAWIASGPSDARVLTATEIGDVTLTGTTAYGPYDLTQLTGEICLSGTPIIPETPITPQTPVTPTVVKQAALAETGVPLLGLLGLAGSFSLIGGGLLNARRLLTGRH